MENINLMQLLNIQIIYKLVILILLRKWLQDLNYSLLTPVL